MNNEQLIRKLNSVGKEAFVTHYYLFRDYASSKISKETAVLRLVNEGRSNEDGAAIRLGNASIIFHENANCDALMIVQISNRLSEQTIRSAKAIYEAECGSQKTR